MIGAEVLIERGQVLEDAVVREQPTRLLEWVGVAQRELTARGEADVRDEGARGDLPRLAREARVVVRRDRLLAHVRRAAAVEPAEAGAVRLAVALLAEAVGRLQQPEGRGRGLAPRAHAEETAHQHSRPATGRAPMRPCGGLAHDREADTGSDLIPAFMPLRFACIR